MKANELKIAGISYLNARPYFFPFQKGVLPTPGRIDLMTPADANDALHRGTHHAGLVSLVAWLDHREAGWKRIPGLEIALFGPAQSIFLFTDKPWEEVGNVVVTEQSATSVELLKVLHAMEERIVNTVPSAEPLREAPDFDGALLIGDDALAARTGGGKGFDLGEIWTTKTGLPMVYAVFAVRPEAWIKIEDLESSFRQALRWSEANQADLIESDGTEALAQRAYLKMFDEGRGHPDLEQAIEKFISLRGKL